jgi:hypothetical protein
MREITTELATMFTRLGGRSLGSAASSQVG